MSVNFQKFQRSKFLNILANPQKIPLLIACFSSFFLRDIFPKYFRDLKILVNSETFWSQKMTLVLPEETSFLLYLNNYLEEGLTYMLIKNLKKGMVFFDIGAHIGYFTLLGSTLVGPSGQIHSFEPTKQIFSLLKKNTKGKRNIVLNNFAVDSKNGSVVFEDFGLCYSAYNTIVSPRLPSQTIKRFPPNRYKIKTISLDQYVGKKRIKPDFIKIDAESAEYQILLGMRKILDDFRPIITLEIGDYNLKNVPKSSGLIKFLIKRGYQPYRYQKGKIIHHQIRKKYTYDNLLFVPK